MRDRCLIFACGLVLWIAYGWCLESSPVIFANLVTLMLAGSIIVMKFVFRRRAREGGTKRPLDSFE